MKAHWSLWLLVVLVLAWCTWFFRFNVFTLDNTAISYRLDRITGKVHAATFGEKTWIEIHEVPTWENTTPAPR